MRKTRKVLQASRGTILWADDDAFLMQPLVELLRDEGFEVLTARTGEETLRLLEDHNGKVSLVILDIMMPPGSVVSDLDSRFGFRTGLVVGRTIKKKYPRALDQQHSLRCSPKSTSRGPRSLSRWIATHEVAVGGSFILSLRRHSPRQS